MQQDAANLLLPILQYYESDYIQDSYATTLEQAFENLRNMYAGIDRPAKISAGDFVSGTNETNKQRFDRMVNKAVGVNLQNSIASEQGVGDILVASTNQNVNLITSIPSEYFKKLETAIYQGTTEGTPLGGLAKQIKEIGNTTDNRAKLIARDQSTKLNSTLSQTRQTNIGVEEYIWKVADFTERTRESHLKNANKRFRWDNPPPTGHPGHDIQCRCIAQAVFKF